MIFKPILPIWIMVIICIILLIFKPKNKNSFIRLTIISILLFVINLRPMIMSYNVIENSNDLDVIFVLDNTISMVAEDYKGNNPRIDGVRSDCEYIINELIGARFTVICFDNSSRIRLPFTTESRFAVEATSMYVYPKEYMAKGSSLNVPKDDILSMVKNNESENRKTIIFFLSDGEITKEDNKLESYGEIKKYIDNGAVLGYGTENGGKMKVNIYSSEKKDYILDYMQYHEYGQPDGPAISKIDEGNLKQIAKDMGIEYIHMDRQSNIDKKLKEIKKMATQNSDNTTNAYIDIYYFFVIPIFILLLIEFFSLKRRLQ